MMRKNMMIIVLLALTVILAGCGPSMGGETQSAPTEKKMTELKLGVLMPMSGDASVYGMPISKAYQMAVDEVNAAGGIAGMQVKLIIEDGKCNPDGGATGTQKLVNVDGVKIVLGGACSGETLAAAPITEAAKVILLSPSATSPKVTTAGDFVFRTSPSDANAGRIAAEKAYGAGYKSAALITETTDY